jgi:hypothetical protein
MIKNKIALAILLAIGSMSVAVAADKVVTKETTVAKSDGDMDMTPKERMLMHKHHKHHHHAMHKKVVVKTTEVKK